MLDRIDELRRELTLDPKNQSLIKAISLLEARAGIKGRFRIVAVYRSKHRNHKVSRLPRADRQRGGVREGVTVCGARFHWWGGDLSPPEPITCATCFVRK